MKYLSVPEMEKRRDYRKKEAEMPRWALLALGCAPSADGARRPVLLASREFDR